MNDLGTDGRMLLGWSKK